MLVHINQTCHVVLNKSGAKILNDINNQCNIRIMNKTGWKMKTDYKHGDMHSTQLWALMEMFGKHIGLGLDAPFVDASINIEED